MKVKLRLRISDNTNIDFLENLNRNFYNLFSSIKQIAAGAWQFC